MNINFSDDPEKLELAKDTAYTCEHNYSRRSRRTAGRPRSPPCSSRCPLLLLGCRPIPPVGRKECPSCIFVGIGHSLARGGRASDFGSFSGCHFCSALCIKIDLMTPIFGMRDERSILPN